MQRPGAGRAVGACLLAAVAVACGPSGGDPIGQPGPAETEQTTDAEESAGTGEPRDVEGTPDAGEEHDGDGIDVAGTGGDQSPPAPEDETGSAPVGPASRDARQSDDFPRWGQEDDASRLVAARLISLPGIDRLVLEFGGPMPSWQVRDAIPPILEQPGEEPVEMPGDSFVEARFVPATTLDRDAHDPTDAYDGPTYLDAQAPGLLEAVLTGDAGDLVVWTLAFEGEPDVAVEVLEDPDRLVIDVVLDDS